MTKVYVLGAGNHATELTEYIQATQLFSVEGYIINIDERKRTRFEDKIWLFQDFISQISPSDDIKLISGFSDLKRKALIQLLEEKNYQFINIIHAHTYISPSVKIGLGNCIAPGCVINTNVHIANHCIVNANCSISHDCTIADYVTISPGVTIAGNVKIGEEVFIGSGATIIPDITIGKGAYIAAGACITKDVPANVMVAGVPAKIKKDLIPFITNIFRL